MLQPFQKRTWAEIDLDTAEHNYKTIGSQLNNNTKLCCMVMLTANTSVANQTINYEFVCAARERIPRVYKKDGVTVDVVDNIV